MRKFATINLFVLSLFLLTGFDYLEFEKNNPHESSLTNAIRRDQADSVKMLVYARVDVNHKTTTGQTPLTLATKKGNMQIVELLVEVGNANTNLRGPYGITPLMYASRYGYADIVDYLLKRGANEKALDAKGKSALLYALEYDHMPVAEILINFNPKLLNVYDDEGNTPMLFATKNNNLEFIKLLTTNGVDINVPDKTGFTPLMYAIKYSDRRVISYLINNGSNLEVRNNQGQTALMIAVENNDYDTTKMLVSKKADVNARDIYGTTPLMFAVKNDNVKIAKLLIKKDADKNAVNRKHKSALLYAIENKNQDMIELIRPSYKKLRKEYSKKSSRKDAPNNS